MMTPMVETGLRVSWSAVAVYWLWSARTVKSTERIEPRAIRLLAYWLPLALAFALLGPGEWFGDGWLHERIFPRALAFQWVAVALCLAGATLAIWSRSILGSNWSSVVVVKQDHALVEAGPYRLVRHPIYTGLLLLFLGNAMLVGDWRGLVAVAIVFASFWRKLRLEEAWLTERFGEAYRDYRARTGALLPTLR
jgi:protein-S-isoprenylcysteine O-methyltransferase Ste14